MIVVILTILFVVFPIIGGYFYVLSTTMRDEASRELGYERRKAGNQMARLLDAAVSDPILPTTDAWRNQARKAASRWFDD